MAKRAAYQTRYHNKASFYVVLGVLLVFAVVLWVNCNSLNEKKTKLIAEQAEYQELLQEEQKEALELQEMEKVAKERLGMVYEDEIIFKKGN